MTAVHTDSSVRVRCIGVRAASQSLKSPTSDTVAARGATTTNPNARALAGAGLEGRSGRHRTTAMNTAAIASAPNGDSRMVRGRTSQRPAHDILPLGLLGGTGVSYAVQRGFVAHEDAPALRRPGARRAAPIHQNAVQPCPEPRPVVTPLERAIRPDERVLERLLGVFAIAEHVHGVAGPAVTVPRDERSICVGVAAEHPPHRLHLALPHP